MWNVLKGMILYESLVRLSEARERQNIYSMAELYAQQINKPLIVIGGPSGGNYLLKQKLGYRAHGCGNICVDIDPHGCDQCSFPIVASITDIPLPNKCGVVYVAHVLEHLDNITDAELAMNELNRIGDAVFICYPSKWSLLAWIHPDHHLWVNENDGIIGFEQR